MHDDSTTGYLVDDLDVARALETLKARDTEVARRAGAVWESITVKGRLPVGFQDRLQAFLWHESPEGLVRGWPTDSVAPPEVAAVTAALFDELGWHRYADICRSATTGEIHAAFERSSKVGHTAARRAEDRSGVQPPHLHDFSFGHVMGPEEYATRVLVSRSLEHAVATNELVIGRSGWRSQQRAITAAVLDTSYPGQPTQSFRSWSSPNGSSAGSTTHSSGVRSSASSEPATRTGFCARTLHRTTSPLGWPRSSGCLMRLDEPLLLTRIQTTR